ALHRANVLNRVSALEPATREAGVGRIDRRAAARRPIDVLVELEPEVGQRVGGVVGVVDRLAARDRVRGGIERRADGVVGALLPVAGPRAARALAQQGRRREREPAKWGRVPHLRRERGSSAGGGRRGGGGLLQG